MRRTRPLSAAIVALTIVGVACGGAAAPTATPTARPAAPAPAATATRAPAQPTPTSTAQVLTPPTVAPTPTAAAKRQQVGTFTYLQTDFVDNNFDPAQYRSSNAVQYMDHLYDSVVEPNLDYRLVGGIGETWTISADGRAWTFKVRKGVKAHDGSEITSADLANAYLRYIKADYRTHSGAQLRGVFDKVETPDPSTVIYRFKAPFPQTLVDLAKYPGAGPGRIYPKSFLPYKDGNDRDEAQAAFKKPVGTGPFKLTRHVFEEVMEFEAVPEHYREAARIKRLVLRVIPDLTTQFAALKAGEADMMVASDLGTLTEALRRPDIKTFSVKGAGGTTCNFYGQDTSRYEKHPFQDIRVRRAMNYAVNKEELIKTLNAGFGEPTAQYPFSPIAIGYDPDLRPFPYDPAMAKKLLAEAGYATGFETDFRTTVNGKTIGEAMQRYFADVGIKLNIRILDAATLGSEPPKHARKEITIPPGLTGCGLSTFISRPDMSSLASVYAHSGERGTYGAVNNPDIDKYLELQEVESDPQKRHELMREVNRAMYNNAVYLWMVQAERVFIARDRVLEWQRIKGHAYPVHFEGLVVKP
ncbi:MAG: ABC transporter substrate-binding protein [Chloroflexi bacterium]|nr:ABC transporter substrate-binding protein [Chloroflexota bacterium]